VGKKKKFVENIDIQPPEQNVDIDITEELVEGLLAQKGIIRTAKGVIGITTELTSTTSHQKYITFNNAIIREFPSLNGYYFAQAHEKPAFHSVIKDKLIGFLRTR
jgi:hypothetical protein